MKKLIVTLFFLIAMGSIIFSQESLEIQWPKKYDWGILSNQEDKESNVLMIIPRNENGENWRIMGYQQSDEGQLLVTFDEVQDMLFEEAKKNTPRAKLTFIEKNAIDEYPWLLFKIEAPKSKYNKTPESKLWYLRQGKTKVFTNFVAVRKKKLVASFEAEWTRIFKESKIVQEVESKDEPLVNYFSIEDTISFNQEKYYLKWSENPSANYYTQEFFRGGDSPDKFDKMLTLSAITRELPVSEAVAEKVKAIKKWKTEGFALDYQVYENDTSEEVILDFLVNKDKIYEWNIYRYQQQGEGDNSHLVLLFYSYRVKAKNKKMLDEFFNILKLEKDNLIAKIKAFPIPTINH